jgi:hypothetical protein
MIFETIKNLSANEKVTADMDNSLNIIDNSIILLLEQGAFDGNIMPFSGRASLVPCKSI